MKEGIILHLESLVTSSCIFFFLKKSLHICHKARLFYSNILTTGVIRSISDNKSSKRCANEHFFKSLCMNKSYLKIRAKLTFGVYIGIIWKFKSGFFLSFFIHEREWTLEIFYLSVLRDIHVLIAKQSLQNTHTSACVTAGVAFWFTLQSEESWNGQKTDFCTAVDPMKGCATNSRPQSLSDNFSLSLALTSVVRFIGQQLEVSFVN